MEFIQFLSMENVFLLEGFFEFKDLFGENIKALWLVSELELVEDMLKLGVVFLEALYDEFELFLSLDYVLLELWPFDSLCLCFDIFLAGCFL